MNINEDECIEKFLSKINNRNRKNQPEDELEDDEERQAMQDDIFLLRNRLMEQDHYILEMNRDIENQNYAEHQASPSYAS